MNRIAVIGGGLAGLTAAIRLAQNGQAVSLFEAAPELGGRTRSFYDRTLNAWVDNGPHLMVGAYRATRRLARDAGFAANIHWQKKLRLPLWDKARGFFDFAPPPWLPLPLGMLLSASRLPGHDLSSAAAMLRVGLARTPPDHLSVAEWLQQLRCPKALIRDMLEPLCLGSMNEELDSANAMSFAKVLKEAFAGHDAARLGWFTKPLSQGLIEPLASYAESLGVEIHTSCRIRNLQESADGIDLEINADENRDSNQKGESNLQRFDSAIIALPAHARNRLLGIADEIETRPITNIHLWFDEGIHLPAPLLGGIGTSGQWFFDVAQQLDEGCSHLCAVISDDQETREATASRISRVAAEIGTILGIASPPISHHRVITERHATVIVRPKINEFISQLRKVTDIAEQPQPGEFPSTIESAVLRGEQAAELHLVHCT